MTTAPDKYIFLAVACPNGHRPAQEFTHNELRRFIESGTLMFYCAVCDLKIPPTAKEIEKLSKEAGLF
jgi:hypothetical protein